MGVQFAVGHNRRVAAVGAAQHFDAQAAGGGQYLHRAFGVAADEVQFIVAAAPLLAHSERLEQESHRRHYPRPGLGYGVQIALGGEVGVHDPVHPGLRGGFGGAGAPGVNGDAGVAAVRLVHYRRHFLLGNGLGIAPSAVGQLDEIHAVLGLAAHFGDHIRHAVGEHAEGMLRRADPRWFVIADAAVGYDEPSGSVDARPLYQPGVDGVAQPYFDKPGAAGDGQAGNAGAQYRLGVAGGPQGAEPGADGAASGGIARRNRREAERQVTVTVNQPRH